MSERKFQTNILQFYKKACGEVKEKCSTDDNDTTDEEKCMPVNTVTGNRLCAVKVMMLVRRLIMH